MKAKRIVVLFLILSFIPVTLLSQELLPDDLIKGKMTVTGVITAAGDGQTLPGVTVMTVDGSEGTITDVNGYYRIKAGASDSLRISFVGMQTTVVPVNGRSVINIALSESVQNLSEIVVVGYGRESRAMLTSSVGKVEGEDIREAPVSSIDAALQGKTTGVQITQNSGTPGASNSTRIRGHSSISGNNEPLYIIDGIPVTTGNFSQLGYGGQGTDALADLNPADIESVSVLKDAAAAAIYGARASNGVILITTKSGRTDKTAINARAYYGWQQVPNKLDMLNARQFKIYRNEASVAAGGLPIYSDEDIEANEVNTNWLNEVLQTAPIGNFELSAAGGSDKTRFYTSMTYFDQEGTLLGTAYDKISGRVNIDHRISDRVKIGLNYGISYARNDRKEGDQSLNSPLANAISLPPIYPIYNEDGTYNEDGPFANPVSIANEQINKQYNFRNLGNVYLDIHIIEGLTFSTKWGIDYINIREHSFDPPTTRQGARYNGLGFETTNQVSNLVSNNTLNYLLTVKEEHNLKFLLGYSFEQYHRRSTFLRGQDFPSPELEYIASAATITSGSASALDRGLNSFFGQVKYNFSNRYLLEFSARYDGSSKFGENNRYGFFPSVAAAWRIIEEPWFSSEVFSDLKIRGSFGFTGNDAIGDFRTIGLYQGGANYLQSPGVYPVQIPNPDLKWETTQQFNLGLETGFIDNRIQLTLDYYNKYTYDLLFDAPIPSSSGFSVISTNIGELTNNGIELGIRADVVKLEEFNWNASLNLSANRNKITKLYEGQPIDDIGRGGNRVMEGEPLGVFYNWNALGVDPTTGDIVFEDVDGDGIITANDRTIIGDPNPDFYGGFTNVFSYKGLTLNIFLQFSYGNDIFNGTRRYIEAMKGPDNQTTAILDRWREPGDVTQVPRATFSDPNSNDRASSRFIEDGSYLRFKNVKLSYDFGEMFDNVKGISSLEVYVMSQNLFTFTNYSGMDPEVNYAGQDPLRMGTDFFTYPQARSFIIGLNLNL